MPVSLNVGHVRSQEFTTKNGPYGIEILFKKRIPSGKLECMFGIPLPAPNPTRVTEPVLQLNWTLSCDGQIVDQWSSEGKPPNGIWASDVVGQTIGGFDGKKGRKYVLDVYFTKDGSALNGTDPLLVVRFSKYD